MDIVNFKNHTNKLKLLEHKVTQLLKDNNLNGFHKILREDLTPDYLFHDHNNTRYSLYKNYNSIFTQVCLSNNLDFVKAAIEKSKFDEDNNFLIGTATATGFIKACEVDNLEMVKYLVSIDNKYQNTIGKTEGINHRLTSFKGANKEQVVVYQVLEDGITNALYKNQKPNSELVEYLFLSTELKNNPTIKFEDLVSVFLYDDLPLFDKLIGKAAYEDSDVIFDIFTNSSLSLPNQKAKLIEIAEHLIYNCKIYEYPGIEAKILKEPILNTVYFTEQLDNSLSKNSDSDTKKIKI